MRRRNYEPFHVECHPHERGFALEFFVSDTERVTLRFPLWWGPALGCAWHVLPDEALMVVMNEVIERKRHQLAGIIEQHVLSRAV